MVNMPSQCIGDLSAPAFHNGLVHEDHLSRDLVGAIDRETWC